jgi:hypothetical protein
MRARDALVMRCWAARPHRRICRSYCRWKFASPPLTSPPLRSPVAIPPVQGCFFFKNYFASRVPGFIASIWVEAVRAKDRGDGRAPKAAAATGRRRGA